MLLVLWLMLGICSLSMLGSRMSNCWCLREKERSRIWGVQMDSLRGLLGIKRIDKVLNARIKQL